MRFKEEDTKKRLRPIIQRLIYKLFCIFIAMLGTSFLYSQIPDEYELMRKYELPKSAIHIGKLSETDSLTTYQGKPFSGLAYELHPKGKISFVKSFRRGIQHGQMMVWYPDGAPQLHASYHAGSPHGRFLGWYANGAVLYNLVLNRGKLGADSILDNDDSRAQSETEIMEKEGTDND